MKALDLGCSSKVPGSTGMDGNPLARPDVLHDIEHPPYPFPDSEFDVIHCGQVLEHISDIVPVMKELHRVGKPGALVSITVPHFSGKTAYMDPSHKSFFAWATFIYFTKDHFYTDARFELVSRTLTFSKMFRWMGVALLANIFPRFYEDYLHGIFPARNICATLRIVKPDPAPEGGG